MKQFFYSILFTLFAGATFAQQSFNCSSHEWYIKQMESDPQFKINQELLEEETKQYLLHKSEQKSAAAAYIIPVVFHVIYTTPAGNISDAQIVDQIEILNKEFNRQQADTALTPAAFKPLAAAFSVEFRLATLDPDGKCTNGINRIYNSLSNCSFEEDDVKSLSYWPNNKYLNVWIVQSMHYSSSMDCNGGGYATFPGGSAALDGINIRGDLISNIGTAAANTSWGNFKGRYLIHELGHWFNLRHIWGDANCGNDQVADTPPAEGSNSGCPNFPHNAFNSCSGSNADGEMYTNYMDYTNGPCLNMFTAGQVARMTACINSPVSGRSNLWSPSNLAATGTADPYTYPVACAAQPALLPIGAIVVCKGDSVKFTDNSYGGLSTSRLWGFPGGLASNLSDSIVYAKYPISGIYPVSLTKNYLSASNTTTFVSKVHVLENTASPNYVYPFSDSFEDPFIFDQDWTVVNPDNDASKWELLYTTAYTGANCLGINNYGKMAPLVDEIISPGYDLSAIQNPTLTFRLHFANRITANYDKLQVFISNNCGKTWQSIYNRVAPSSLNTVSGNIAGSNTPFPGSDDDWRLEKINIINSWAAGIVKFKFVFTSGGGNNIFIDDINIEGRNTTGLKEHNIRNDIEIFPNPASALLSMRVLFPEDEISDIEIHDLLGSVVLSPAAKVLGEEIHMDVSALKNGVYFLQVTQKDGSLSIKKFIKQNAD